MQPFEWLALGTFFLAGLTALWTLRLQRQVSQLQVRKLEREEAALQRGDVQVWCRRKGRHDHEVIVENVGGALAGAVSFRIRCRGDFDPVPKNIRRRHLPIERLPPGEFEVVPVIFVSRCVPPLPATVTWTDPDGTEREEEITVRVR